MSPILILSASVGCGHMRAAQAIETALYRLRPDATVEHIDVLKLANRAFRRIYGQGYFDLVAKTPHLIGHLYDHLDHPPRKMARPLEKFRSGLQQASLAPLVNLLTSRPWDLAINTHFLPAEIIGTLRSAGRIDFPQITVTTDFDTHRLWHNPHCDCYFTATEEGRLHLADFGVPIQDIFATGIPVDPVFTIRKDPLECRRRYGLSVDRAIVLQLAGGLGIGRIAQLHAKLLETKMPLHLVVVTGRNADALRQIQKIPCPPKHDRTILGFTDAMDELMAAADVVVTKPGGLTSSEALARGTPMIIVDPIPGQETRNADYLLENGAALKVNHPASLAMKVEALLSEPSRLRKMRTACLRAAKPNAAFDVARHALQMIGVDPAPRAAVSRGAAQDFSPWRKPWEKQRNSSTAPAGA